MDRSGRFTALDGDFATEIDGHIGLFVGLGPYVMRSLDSPGEAGRESAGLCRMKPQLVQFLLEVREDSDAVAFLDHG